MSADMQYGDARGGVTVQLGSEENAGELLDKNRTGFASSRSLPCGKLPFPKPFKNFKTFTEVSSCHLLNAVFRRIYVTGGKCD